MKLKQLIKSIGINRSVFNDFEVRGLSCNSKDVLDGFIFVAVKGNKQDGNEFIDEAVAKGARIIITESNSQTAKQSSSPPPARAGL